jgi:flagellar basal-body rod protein FlgB
MNIFEIAARKMEHNLIRHRVITENIANANTPDFKARDVVSFGDLIKKGDIAQSLTSASIQNTRASIDPSRIIKTPAKDPLVLSGNNVSVDEQMKNLSEVHRSQMLELGLTRSFHRMTLADLLTIVLIIAIWREWPRITSSYFVETSVAPSAIVEIFISLLGPMMICIIALSIADLFLSRFRWLRNLKMSRHEIKEEYRQTEGDPLVRSRMKSIALSRARRRILTEVPKATMIVANPTHYAIALRYVSGETNVPVVLAKGTDYLAIKIRETADENFIPIVENKRLARAMYNEVDIGKIIPPEFFRGIAEIVIMLKAMREGRPYRPPSGSRIVHGRPAAA